MTTTKTTSYPWDSIDVPLGRDGYSVRLAGEEENPAGKRIFWGKNWLAHPAVIIEYDATNWSHMSLPSFKNIEVEDHRSEGCLSIELLDLSMRDIFLKVGLDIISTLQPVSPKASRRACVLRLERWSSFLRPSRSKLSPEQQKGLIAELMLLANVAVPVYGELEALNGWTGPEAGPRDYAFGQTFIEVKSKRSSANPNIVISSEEQLNFTDKERLFLFVAEVNSAPAEDETSFTLDDVVNKVRTLFTSSLMSARLDSKLASAGYFVEDGYSDCHWTVGEEYYYQVMGDFPRIDSKTCAPGVSKVNYQVDLDYCEDYRIDLADLKLALEV